MQIALSILMIITLCGMNFALGFFIGKGKIEIRRKLTKEEQKEFLKTQEEQRKAIEEYNKKLHEITGYNDSYMFGGDE